MENKSTPEANSINGKGNEDQTSNNDKVEEDTKLKNTMGANGNEFMIPNKNKKVPLNIRSE